MSSRDLVVAAAGSSGAAKDDYFKNVSLLLSGDGTNGAQNNTFLDSSANNFTITRNGNTTQGTFSPYGSLWSNYFDGTGDYLNAGQQTAFDLGSGAYTVECFVCVTDLTTSSCVFDYSNPTRNANGDSAYRIDVGTTGNVETAWTTGASTAIYLTSSNGLIQVGKWAHIAVVRNGSGNWSLFVDGTRAATSTNSNTMYTPASRNFKIGQESTTNPTRNFDGYISNFRLVKGSAVYDPTASTLTVPTTPLTAVSGTSLLTCQSNRFKDNSSNNFTLTVNGTPSVQRFSPFNPTAPYSASTIGGSGYFDGAGDYLSIANNAAFQFGTGDFTVEFMFYNTGTLLGMLAMNGTTNGSWAVAFSGSNLNWQTNTATTNLYTNSTTSMPKNAWNHVAIVRASGTNKMYFNGVVQSNTASDSTNYASTASLYIGLWPGVLGGGFNEYFTGYLSNVRIVKGTAVYTSNFTPPTAPLTAISGTSLLTNFTNAGIPDAAMQNDLETVGNAQVSTSVKKYGTGSLYFDGTGDWLSIPSNNALSFGSSDFTIECWMYWSGNNGNWTLCNKAGDWRLSADTNRWVYSANPGVANVFVINWTPTTGTWYHVACVRNGTTTTMYINGTSIGSGTSASTQGATNSLTIGAFSDGSYPFTGYIDDLRITKGVARYTANFTPPTQALPTN